jgi:hypothetical protein
MFSRCNLFGIEFPPSKNSVKMARTTVNYSVNICTAFFGREKINNYFFGNYEGMFSCRNAFGIEFLPSKNSVKMAKVTVNYLVNIGRSAAAFS